MKEENLDEKVPVRAYTKADLAMLYNPGVCITTALQLLRRWIYANRQLMAELKEAGYNKKPFHPLFPLFPCQLINREYAKFKTAILPLPYRLSRPFHPGSFP